MGSDSATTISSNGKSPMLSKLDALMAECEAALMEAKGRKDVRQLLRILKEMRGFCELKTKMEAAERRIIPAPSQQRVAYTREEGDLRFLCSMCWKTRNFDPLRLWQLKTLHDKVLSLSEAKLSPEEIVRQMSLPVQCGVLTLPERIFGILYAEEWIGREQQVAESIVRHLRQGLNGYPEILQHLDITFAKTSNEPPPNLDYHRCLIC